MNKRNTAIRKEDDGAVLTRMPSIWKPQVQKLGTVGDSAAVIWFNGSKTQLR